jgi:hypothetical protein
MLYHGTPVHVIVTIEAYPLVVDVQSTLVANINAWRGLFKDLQGGIVAKQKAVPLSMFALVDEGPSCGRVQTRIENSFEFMIMKLHKSRGSSGSASNAGHALAGHLSS